MKELIEILGYANYVNIVLISKGVRPSCILQECGPGRDYVLNTDIPLDEKITKMILSFPNTQYTLYQNCHVVYNINNSPPNFSSTYDIGLYLGYPIEILFKNEDEEMLSYFSMTLETDNYDNLMGISFVDESTIPTVSEYMERLVKESPIKLTILIEKTYVTEKGSVIEKYNGPYIS